MRLVLLLLIGGLMHAARSFAPMPAVGSGPAGTALAFGFLLLAAYLTGDLAQRMRLPRLTGYIAAGIVAGPCVLALVSEPMVNNLRIFNGVAIALIALTAGTEMELSTLRPLLRTIGWITLVAVLGTTGLLAGAVYLARPMLPFMQGLGTAASIAVALVLGVTMVAQSPAVSVALRDELAADGPVARTVMGVVVISDLVVILLFAVVSSLAKAVLGGQADVLATAGMLAWEILGSAVVGVIVGALVAIYMRKVASGGPLFLLTVSVVVAEVGQRLHFDPLLIALAAGIFLRNATRHADRVHADIGVSSLPIYVTFFAVAGATIHLDVLATVLLPAALFVGVRAVGFLVGTPAAAAIAGAPEPVRRYAGFGLLPQAGLALALALLFARAFPAFGASASALTLGVVALNEIFAPVLFRWSLVRSGEAGRKARGPEVAEPAANHG